MSTSATTSVVPDEDLRPPAPRLTLKLHQEFPTCRPLHLDQHHLPALWERGLCACNCTFELSLMRTFDAFSTTQFDPMWTIVLNVQERIRRVSEKVEGPQDDPIYLYFYRCHSWYIVMETVIRCLAWQTAFAFRPLPSPL